MKLKLYCFKGRKKVYNNWQLKSVIKLIYSFQLENPSAWGLYATLSLALVHQDLELADLVLKELEKLKDSVRCLPHYSVLLSYVYLLQVILLSYLMLFYYMFMMF